jgi:DNA-binding XRE family transcriptional regulator
MNTLTESVQILRDAGGHPAFAVIPFADYQALVKGKIKVEPGIPAPVVDLAMDNEWSAARAWREHKELTQVEVAQRMDITQGAYAQLEAKKTIRKSSREKIAKALGIHESQLDF